MCIIVCLQKSTVSDQQKNIDWEVQSGWGVIEGRSGVSVHPDGHLHLTMCVAWQYVCVAQEWKRAQAQIGALGSMLPTCECCQWLPRVQCLPSPLVGGQEKYVPKASWYCLLGPITTQLFHWTIRREGVVCMCGVGMGRWVWYRGYAIHVTSP